MTFESKPTRMLAGRQNNPPLNYFFLGPWPNSVDIQGPLPDITNACPSFMYGVSTVLIIRHVTYLYNIKFRHNGFQSRTLF